MQSGASNSKYASMSPATGNSRPSGSCARKCDGVSERSSTVARMSMKTGEVLREYGPWLLVRGDDGFVVVDRSVEPPARVHGPATRKDCEAHCRVNQHIWTAVMMQGEWT